MVGDPSLRTESFDQGLCIAQPVPGHRWKQVMLNLVVQSAIPVIEKPVTTYISGREDLGP